MSPLHGYRARIDSPDEPSLDAADLNLEAVPGEAVADKPWAYGPCLHLASNGRRCERPALEDGFCARHSSDGIESGAWIWFRRIAALLLAAAILWPIIEDFLSELSRRPR
jgi:hypothetical protein